MGFLAGMTPVSALMRLAAGFIDNRAARRTLAQDIDFAQLLQKSLGGPGAGVFKEMDTDGDNRISLSEFGGDENLFAQMDTDKNASLSVAELNRGLEAKRALERATGQAEYTMKLHDANVDGRLSQDELGLGEKVFASLDGNGDRSLSVGELSRGYLRQRELLR